MRKPGALWRAMVWLTLGVALWVGAASAYSAWQAYTPGGRVSVRNANAAYTADDLTALRKAMDEGWEGGRAAGFAQQLSQSVTAPYTAGSASCDVLWVDGDAGLVFDVVLIDGHLPVRGDNEGCALSAATARTLFGSTDVVGRTVKLAGTELTVRGVFDAPDGLTTLLADPGREMVIAPLAAAPEGTTMTALEILPCPSEGETSVEAAKAAMQRAGLSTGGTIDDASDTRSLLGLLTGVPALLCLMLTLLTALSGGLAVGRRFTADWRALRENRLTPGAQYARLCAWFGACLLSLLGASALAVWLLPALPMVPPSYLPTAWSDFSFWSDLVTGALEDAAQGALSGALRPDMIRSTLTGWVVALSLLSVVCLLRGRGLLRAAAECVSLPTAVLSLAPAVLAVPAALWAMSWIGWPPTAYFAMLALPLLPTVTHLGIMKGALYVKPAKKKPLVVPGARVRAGALSSLRSGRRRGGHRPSLSGEDSLPAGRG